MSEDDKLTPCSIVPFIGYKESNLYLGLRLLLVSFTHATRNISQLQWAERPTIMILTQGSDENLEEALPLVP